MKKLIPMVLATAALSSPLSATAQTGDSVTPEAGDAGAPDVKTFTNEKETEVSRDPSGKGFAAFGGLGLGYGILSADQPEVGKTGLLFNARLTGSYIDEKVIYDVGLGWLYSNLNGTDTVTNTKVKVLTQNGVLELSPRYRATKNFDIGPIGQVMFGTDASFGEDSSEAGAHVFIGAKAMYTVTSEDFHYRFGVQATTDLTIQKRQVWMPMAIFEIGIPLLRNKTILRERETVRVEKSVEKVVLHEGDKFTFDDEVVHFEVDKSVLYPESREFFMQLGKFLSENPGVYQTIEVHGHTDNTGTPEHNQLLAQDRARAVAGVLIEAGVPADRVKSEGHGQDQPIDTNDTDIGRARNRRVEMTFGEGADTKRLHEEIKRIKFRTVKPSTCAGDSCR